MSSFVFSSIYTSASGSAYSSASFSVSSSASFYVCFSFLSKSAFNPLRPFLLTLLFRFANNQL